MTGQQFVQDQAQRVLIAGRTQRRAAQLLRRGPMRRQFARTVDFPAQDRRAVRRDQDRFRTEVTEDDEFAMRAIDDVGQGQEQAQAFAESAFDLAQPLRERDRVRHAGDVVGGRGHDARSLVVRCGMA